MEIQNRKGRVMATGSGSAHENDHLLTKREKLIRKMQAVYAKTEAGSNCSEEEMFLALRTVRAMQDAYEVSDEELQQGREEKVLLHDEAGEDIFDSNGIKGQLCSAVAKFCGVRIYSDDRKEGGLTFLGFKSDIENARGLLDWVADQVHHLLFEHLLDCDCLSPRDRKREIHSFVMGCTGRIAVRMLALCKQSETARTKSGKELVVITDRAIKDYMAAEGIQLCRGRASRAAFSQGGYDAGQSAGDRVGFGKPVSGGAGAVLRIGKA
jgi:hypothetical protein